MPILQKFTKNIHIHHLEDLAYYNSTNLAIDIVRSTVNSILKKSSDKITIKYDGRPAIVFGYLNGKFFVSTKSALNIEKIIYFSIKDIEKTDYSTDLKNILKKSFKYLPNLINKGIYQADVLYIKDNLFNMELDGESSICFQPNTLLYSIPQTTETYKFIKNSELGLSIHTEYLYKNNKFQIKSLDIKDSNFKKTNSVWIAPSKVSHFSEISKQTISKINNNLVQADLYRKSISDSFFSMLDSTSLAFIVINSYNNFILREKNKGISLKDYIKNRQKEQVDLLKTEAGKNRKFQEYENILKFINIYSQDLNYIEKIRKILVDIKLEILNLVNNLDIKLYLTDNDGYTSTSAEGLVISHNDHIIKLVDRMTFSLANFNRN